MVGQKKTGKSFLCSLLNRILEQLGNPSQQRKYSEDEPLSGFPWGLTSYQHGSGVFINSSPIPFYSGRNLMGHIVLLDIQGNENEVKHLERVCSVFASSVLVNVLGNFSLEDLNSIKNQDNFEEFNVINKTLCFVFRDTNSGENKQVDLPSHFEANFFNSTSISLPLPGQYCHTFNFHGIAKDLNADFKNGVDLLGEKVKEWFDTELKKCTLGKAMPALLKRIVQKNNIMSKDGESRFQVQSVIQECKEIYDRQLKALCGPMKPYVNNQIMNEAHGRAVKLALDRFESCEFLKSCDINILSRAKEDLMMIMNCSFEEFKELNESKSCPSLLKRLTGEIRTMIIILLIIMIGFALAATCHHYRLHKFSPFGYAVVLSGLMWFIIWICRTCCGDPHWPFSCCWRRTGYEDIP